MNKIFNFIIKHNIKITLISLLFPIILQLKAIISPPLIALYDKIPSFSQTYDAILSVRNPFREEVEYYYSNAANIVENKYRNIKIADSNFEYSREDIINIKLLIKFLLKLQNDNYTSLNRENEINNKNIINKINQIINDIENYNFKSCDELLTDLAKNNHNNKIVQYLGFQAIINLFIKPDDPIKSINLYNKALSYSPDSLFILNNFAQLYSRFDDFENAEKIYLKIIELAKKKVKKPNLLSLGYSNLGSLYLMQKNYINALKYFNFALQINKKYQLNLAMATQYNNIALTYEKQNNLEKSCVNYRRARIIFYRYYQDQQAEKIFKKLKQLKCL